MCFQEPLHACYSYLWRIMGVSNVPWWEFLEWTSAVPTLCLETGAWRCVAVICRATMMECLWCWQVWVLLSKSKICDTKKRPVSCVQGSFWPLLGSRGVAQSLRVTFLLFAVTVCLFFDDNMFQCVFFFFVCYSSVPLCSQTWLLSPFLYKGL